jgi:hypothetical protein
MAAASEGPGVLAQGPENGGFGVNPPLTPKRRREASEIGDMVARMTRALARRAEGGDLEALRALVRCELAVILAQRQAAKALHEDHGYSWGEIGLGLAISKQAAWKRWGREG